MRVLPTERDEFWPTIRYHSYRIDRRTGPAAQGSGGDVNDRETMTGPGEITAVAAAVRAGDASAFSALAERHRRELLVHCYRMLGSFQDAEDAVQDALLRAWRYRESLKDGAPLRPWLYRVATNSCFDAIARDPRRSALAARTASDAPEGAAPGPSEVAWLQPFPDARLEAPAPRDSEPEAVVLSRETIELAFLTVIQLLTPQQRAALILRDVLGWSAQETAELLETSVAAANSALQRARASLRARLLKPKPEWPSGVDATAAERELLQKFVAACEQPDLAGFTSLIREDAVQRMPPDPEITVGREAIFRHMEDAGFGSEEFGQLRCVTTRANRQPAVACYVLQKGDTTYRALAVDVLRIEEGLISEIVTFGPEVFGGLGLPMTLDAQQGAGA
jgi:RNA polymerase sigma-70 factor (ECF subfamily)